MNDKPIFLKRTSFDVALLGGKNRGKTMLMSYIGFQKFRMGCLVFSNYKLNFPHTLIDNLDDIDIINHPRFKDTPKVFLGDDFERWYNSRMSHSKLNKSLDSILLDFGKSNCSIIYSAKRLGIVDKSLRLTTDRYLYIELMLPVLPDHPALLPFWKHDLRRLVIHGIEFDDNLLHTRDIMLGNLPVWRKLYDTQEIVKKIDIEDTKKDKKILVKDFTGGKENVFVSST